MLKCREDARIDHPGDEALHVKAQTTPGKKTVACAYPVVISTRRNKEEKEDASIYEVSPHILK
jgi:hypothetical protein